MKLAILHHHLNPGGVTRVIENHLRALVSVVPDRLDLEQVLLVYGGRAVEWPMQQLVDGFDFNLDWAAVEGFDYDLTGQPADGALGDQLAEALARRGFTPEETILHWHNHSLGKNASTPLAVDRLARAGYRLLLQIHDFAEDFRPQNYRYLQRKLAAGRGAELPELLYPQSESIHYAVLNGRDSSVLARAGVTADRLHFLPNPVSPPPVDADRRRARATVTQLLDLPAGWQLVVYPVRGIRRKNLAEMLLWSTVVDQTMLAVTMPPKNPLERKSFDRWQSLAAKLDLPCRFGTHQTPFGVALAASDALLTTSVAEGFGMVFLEAWLAGRPLIGRRLPEITADFTARGVVLDHLYDALAVPTDQIDKRDFREQMMDLARALYRDFGVTLPDEAAMQSQLDELMSGDVIDFARLPTTMQAEVIERTASDSTLAARLRQQNEHLHLPGEEVAAQIDANAAAVEQHFSLAEIGQLLADAYDALQRSTPSDKMQPLSAGGAILEAFLSIDRLHALRVEA